MNGKGKRLYIVTFGCPTFVSRALRSALALGHAKSLKMRNKPL